MILYKYQALHPTTMSAEP